jgi:hypothetical protein
LPFTRTIEFYFFNLFFIHFAKVYGPRRLRRLDTVALQPA